MVKENPPVTKAKARADKFGLKKRAAQRAVKKTAKAAKKKTAKKKAAKKK
ncbi:MULTISPECIES: hypothetical protein [unclassified Bradyrhizobium]|nr:MULTISPECIES: hypothetical protein [unclassified Bradyrhizobium]